MKLVLNSILGILCLSLFAMPVMADENVALSKAATAQETEKATQHNLHNSLSNKDATFIPLRPVEEYGNFRYLLLTGYSEFSPQAKETIVKNLPANITLILLVKPGAEASIKSKFAQWIDSNRIIIATHADAGYGFWARDSFPIPVFKDVKGNVGLVSHEYFRPFAAHKVIANTVKAEMNSFSHYFVGGNLLADETGQCFTVDSERLFGLTASQIKELYGCKNVQILPYKAGIGDVDEVVKPLPGKKILTNIDSYVPTLQNLGYQVIKLPKLSGLRTYANSVILGKTVFMPSYGESSEAEAIQVYESLGYSVVPVNSQDLSDNGAGSLHCISMAYPKIDVNKLLKMLNAKRI